MKHIFISYSRADTEYVDEIAGRLETEGYDVWIDRGDIFGGSLWREKIVEAIEKSFAVLVVLSANSVYSDNVRTELDLAKDEKLPILPVTIGEVSIPSAFKYQLAGIQRIQFGPNEDDNIRLLTVALKSIRPPEKEEQQITEPSRPKEAVETLWLLAEGDKAGDEIPDLLVEEGQVEEALADEDVPEWLGEEAFIEYPKPSWSELDIAQNWDGQTSMRGFDLSGLYLRKVFLEGADLSDADLSDAYLYGANLHRAKLNKAVLHGARLVVADLSEAKLVGADLRWARMAGADLRRADLTRANLQGADLRRVTYTFETQWPTGFDPEEAGAVMV